MPGRPTGGRGRRACARRGRRQQGKHEHGDRQGVQSGQAGRFGHSDNSFWWWNVRCVDLAFIASCGGRGIGALVMGTPPA
jgi:hypothetical protein